MLLLLGSKAVAQPTGAEASAYMAQEKSSGVPLVAPPGFAPEHLSLLYRPRYTLVPPALFGVTKSATAGANAPANTGRGNAPSNAKAANGAYQPLPVQPRSVRSSYDQPPGGRRNADYQSLRLIPALVPLAGSHVPIPAPIVRRGNGAYDAAPPGGRDHGRPLMPAGNYDKVPPGTGRSGSGVQYSSLPADNASGNGAFSSVGSQGSNTSSSFKTETTAGANSGYQALPVHSGNNAALPGSNVSIPPPLVQGGSQRSGASSSFKTETSAGSNSGYQGLPVNNAPLPGSNVSIPQTLAPVGSQRSNTSSSFKTETTAGGNSGYQALPVRAGNNAALPSSNVSIPPPLVQGGSQRSSTSSSFKTETSAGGNPGYQALPLKSGYESANSGLSSGSSTGTQTSPAKQNTYDKITPQSGSGYENAKSAMGGAGSVGSSVSGGSSGYQTLPLKSGYESANSGLSSGSSTGNQTSPAKQNTYDKVTPQSGSGYENAKSAVGGTGSGGSSGSGSNSGYQTLPVKQINFDRAGSASTSGPTGSGSGKIPAGGYESVNAALNGGSSSGYQTLPVRPNTYGKPAPGRATADYDNIKSLARPATGGGTTSPGSVRGVPLPASKPAAQPVTAKYMPAPKGKPLSPASTGKTNSPAGSGEFKRGVSTTENFKTLPGAGSGSRGAIRLPPVKQSETEAAKKAKEASTKRELQRKLGAKKPGRK